MNVVLDALKKNAEAAKVYIANLISGIQDELNETPSYTNRLQRNKVYKVGDIAYSSKLPSWAYLECITSGTTGDSEPDMSSVSSGGTVTDGTAQFVIRQLVGVLSGCIMAFRGTFSDDGYPIDKKTGLVDKTWHLCDGTNDTPDLRNRFILGASSNHAVDTSGGEETHVLSANEMPSHTHTITYTSPKLGVSGGSAWYVDAGTRGVDGSVIITSSSAGNNQSHNNMPPYYVLSYIMKL